MALTKDHTLTNPSMCLNHVYPYYENNHFVSDQLSPVVYEKHKKLVFEDVDPYDHSPTKKSSSSLSSPTSTNSSSLAYQTFKYQSADEGNSVINFNSGFANSTHSIGSLLNFEENIENFHPSAYPRIPNQDDFSTWEDDLNIHHNIQRQVKTKSKTLIEKEVQFGWIRSEPIATTSGITNFGREETCLNKRPYVEESNQATKKQCISPEKQLTPKISPSKDPQSLAAKNRRERISDRLKTLQELVPNGSKVDLVTMLEKAINYVKFLQLQVKVLATDDFWPVQGGKAPELSQVKDALDAILATQRDRNSSSK